MALWTLGFVGDSPQGARYRELSKRSPRPDLHGGGRCHPETQPDLRRVEFFTSHEALLLGFEEAMTRVDSTSGDWYDTSAHHAVDRRAHPRQLDGAHIEYMRGVKNPIGLKCGPAMEADDLAAAGSTCSTPPTEPGASDPVWSLWLATRSPIVCRA
ncbi:3-deoxy-7-phosphoheptulonate synthase [Caulobacter sp. B11]|uniref:3-deoxy-7-phosphoheptulonate synthase n=1 Tax=Caulobacter sp. B11 TaxID=2048899 RepID=UPI002101A8BE|nr:3-deoxy-7-phosphoheptulonate synthase [Caulobacter sp. B11]